MDKIKQIIWDWNGTLLDDVSMCVEVMNAMLKEYNLPVLSCTRYKQIFDFPVEDYYKTLGFDFNKHPFEKVGHEFMDGYFEALPACPLFTDSKVVLERFKAGGYLQHVLSAMEHQSLLNSLQSKGILPYFLQVQGISNHLAQGKKDRAVNLLNATGLKATESLFVGDTLHDLEVAHSLGSPCVLIANGHFSKERLLAKHNNVFDSLTDFTNSFFKGR